MNSLLFIEDDDHIRLALRLVLEDEGYRVREAADGRSGLAAFHAEEPDLVLSEKLIYRALQRVWLRPQVD